MFGLFKKNKDNNTAEKKRRKHSEYVNWWLFRDEGTVAEKYTMKELWNDPEVQKEIAAVKRAFAHTKKTQPDN